MRKISLLLAVLLFAVPAFAGSVTITCSEAPDDGNSVVVSYAVASEPNKVRALALDITIDQGAKIIGVSRFKVGESVGPSDKGYGIFPGSFDKYEIDPDDPNWADPNYSPLADPCDYPDDTLGGVDRFGVLLDTNGITVEMGALYYPTNDGSPNSPGTSGELLRITFGGLTPGCHVTITQNVARSGVVLTDPDEPFDFISPGYTFLGECLIGGAVVSSEKPDWLAWNRPKCWCYPRQCRGDINGKRTTARWVQALDLGIFRSAFFKNDTVLRTVPNGICADLNHRKQTARRVQAVDLSIFRSYFFKGDSSVPVCDTYWVYTGPYNFWRTPTD